MTAVADIIAQALKVSGVLGIGQVASAYDTSDALVHVNLILGQWSRKRWLNVDLVDVILAPTGARSYTIGAGGAVNVPRPDRIVAAFNRLLQPAPLRDAAGNVITGPGGVPVTDGGSTGGIDYPIRIIASREEYNGIAIKGLAGWPQALFYDSAYPLGSVYLYPVPVAGTYEIHLSLKPGMAAVTDPTQPLLLPPEFEDALLWTLAARLRPAYQMPPEPTVTAAMRAALNTVRTSYAQTPLARMPPGMPGRAATGYGSSLAAFMSGYTV